MEEENFRICQVTGKLASAKLITVRFAILWFESNTERFKRLHVVPHISSRQEKTLQMPLAPTNQ